MAVSLDDICPDIIEWLGINEVTLRVSTACARCRCYAGGCCSMPLTNGAVSLFIPAHGRDKIFLASRSHSNQSQTPGVAAWSFGQGRRSWARSTSRPSSHDGHLVECSSPEVEEEIIQENEGPGPNG